MKPADKPLALITGAILLLAFGCVIKVVLNAYGELSQGKQSLEENKLARAAIHFDRAIRWHLPFLGTADEAAGQMFKIAELYEKKGFEEKALEMYRSLRGAFYSTRSFFTPGQEWIDRCNDKIATLMAKAPATAPAIAARSFEQRREDNLKLLTRDASPHTGWAVVAEAGFFGWVICLAGLVIQGFTPRGEFRRRPAVLWSLAFVLFFTMWGYGLSGA